MADDSGNESFPTSGNNDKCRCPIVVNKFPTLARLAAAVPFSECMMYTPTPLNHKLHRADKDKIIKTKGEAHGEPTMPDMVRVNNITNVTLSTDRLHGLSISNNLTYHHWRNIQNAPTISFSHQRMDANDKATQPSQRIMYWHRMESDSRSTGTVT
jgi:hypothetical protein